MKDATPTTDDVPTALQLLQDALGEEEARIREEGSNAMKDGDYDTATAVIDFAKRLLAFQHKVGAMSKEWSELEELREKATPAVQEIISKRFFGRASTGEITSQWDFCRYLLEVLVEMGGSGKVKDVLDRLGEKMKDGLKPKDYEPHESNANQIRWRNTAQWARNFMVNEDNKMKKGSPRGVWEISKEGRAWLKKHHRSR